MKRKRKFRNLVRFAIRNLFWLRDTTGEKIEYDVKRNVDIIWRRKSKRKLLTIQDISLVNSPSRFRSGEKQYVLLEKLKGLDCFRNFTLVGVTKFHENYH